MESRLAPRLLGYAGLAPGARLRGAGEKGSEPARLSAVPRRGAPRKGGRAVTAMHSTGKVRGARNEGRSPFRQSDCPG